MTNNKSEHCEKCLKCPDYPTAGHDFCHDKECECHLGDSLRKQEEVNQCDGCLRNLPIQNGAHYTKDGRIDTYCQRERYTPKVATSEKEIKGGFATTAGMNTESFEKVWGTSHESEDWEAEFEKIDTEIINESWARIQNPFISKKIAKDFIRKAYQRGREEGYTETCGRFLPDGSICNVRLDCHLHDWRQKEEVERVLSLAVQEIEKEKECKDCENREIHDTPYNQGLDKAKSIISWLMKK